MDDWLQGLYEGPLPIRLSQRHVEILTLLCQGYSSPQIGKKLFLSPETVKSYRRDLILRLGARNSTHAACIYLVLSQNDYVEIG